MTKTLSRRQTARSRMRNAARLSLVCMIISLSGLAMTMFTRGYRVALRPVTEWGSSYRTPLPTRKVLNPPTLVKTDYLPSDISEADLAEYTFHGADIYEVGILRIGDSASLKWAAHQDEETQMLKMLDEKLNSL